MLNPLVRRRTDRAADTLPQTGVEALFTISGLIVVTQVIGVVTTAIQNQANNTKLIMNPTTGTDVDICAVLNIANDEVGTIYGITGLFSDALLGAGQAMGGQTRNVLLGTGTLDLSCAASNTGAVKWTLYWAPVEGGSYVAPA